MTENHFTVRAADWAVDAPLLRPIRQAVFIDEQRVPEELEWDDLDAHCLHALALDDAGNPIGCGRLTADAKIGRMAVLAPWRKAGVGGAILRFLIDAARERGATDCRLDAQIEALDFYHRHGFIAEGDEFLDANIRHRRMRLTLPERRDIDSLAACRDAAVAVAAVARFDLAIFTHDLDAPLFDQAPFLERLKSVALAHERLRVRVLVRDSGRAVRAGHRMIELGRRLPSTFEFRRTHADHQTRADAFLMAEGLSVLYRPLASRYEGWFDRGRSAAIETLQREFAEMWEAADPDPELRVLGI